MKATFTSAVGSHHREALGRDDVSDAELAGLVADLWEVERAHLLDSVAQPVDYEVPSILTGARTWVRGHADAGGGAREFGFFVKRVHHWRHSPAFAFVPPELRDWAADSLPWRAELLAYRSDLRDRLPEGLSMPRAVLVAEHDDETATLWLEAVDADDVAWDVDDHARAARLLGRLAASRAVAPVADLDPQPWTIHAFVTGRIAHTVLPGLHDDATWEHPVMVEHFGGLRAGLVEAAGRLDDLAREFAAQRHLASHGDACPNNLLRRRGDRGFTVIDFGFWRSQPVGFDLSQLLVGDVQVGRRDADDLVERAEACLAAYADGLADEGSEIGFDELLRSHAVSLMLFNGLPSLPLEMLNEHRTLTASGGLTESHERRLSHWAAQRAGVARYALDVLARTDA